VILSVEHFHWNWDVSHLMFWSYIVLGFGHLCFLGILTTLIGNHYLRSIISHLSDTLKSSLNFDVIRTVGHIIDIIFLLVET